MYQIYLFIVTSAPESKYEHDRRLKDEARRVYTDLGLCNGFSGSVTRKLERLGHIWAVLLMVVWSETSRHGRGDPEVPHGLHCQDVVSCTVCS